MSARWIAAICLVVALLLSAVAIGASPQRGPSLASVKAAKRTATTALKRTVALQRRLAAAEQRIAALEAATAPITAGLSAAEIVIGTSAYEAGSGFRSAAAACPAGKRVIGGGGDVQGVAGPQLVESSPRATTTTWFARGYAAVSPGAWQVVVYAVCAAGY